MTGSAKKLRYAVCLSNDRYAASLEPRKIYAVLEDADAARHGLLRVIDETGESYLYPKSRFAHIKLPPDVERVIAAKASATRPRSGASPARVRRAPAASG